MSDGRDLPRDLPGNRPKDPRDLPAGRNLDASIVEISDLKDEIELLYGKRRERRRSMVWLGLVAVVFLVWGMIYGTPGYVAAAVLTVFQIVPVARHIEISEEIRRAEWKLDRLLLRRGSVGDPGRGTDAPVDGGSVGDPETGANAPAGGGSEGDPVRRPNAPAGGGSEGDPVRRPNAPDDGGSGSADGPPDRGRRAPGDDRGP